MVLLPIGFQEGAFKKLFLSTFLWSGHEDILFLFVFPFVLYSNFSLAATIHVPAVQPTIQAGIDAASNGDTVRVADGTHVGVGNKDIDFKGKAITVESENGAANCIIDCEGEGRGFYFHSGEGGQSVLSGFTITKGLGYDIGGGIYCTSNSSPTIINCAIIGNHASKGVGIACDLGSSPAITNCTIGLNGIMHPGHTGGGIYCSSASPTITNCTIYRNSFEGIYCSSGSSPIIANCTISQHAPYSDAIGYMHLGAGIYCGSDSNPTISACTISDNGMGIFC